MKKSFFISVFVLLSFFVNNAFSVVTTIPAGAGPYATLGAAFTAINAGGPYAGVAVTVTINASEVLAAPVTIGPATFTSLLLRPSGAVTIISGVFDEALIVVNGSDFVTIDGLNTAGNSLTLTNTNTGLNSGSIRLSNGATNNTLRNLTCNGVGVAVAQGGRTINVGQSNPGTGGNNNNTIERCTVNGGRRGIQTFGTAGGAGYTNDNTVIKNCIVKNCSSLGIFIGSETRDNTVQDCEVYDDPATVTQDAAGGYRAMGLQGVGTTNILRNKIHDLQSVDPTVPYIAIISIPAPLTAPGSNTSTVNFINNFVNLNVNNQAGFIYGIAPLSNTTTVPYTSNVFYNTVRLSGSSPVTVAGQYTGAYPVDVEAVGSTVNFKNNVGINDRTGGSTTSLHIGVDLTPYPFAGVILNSDYNLSYASDTVSGWAGGFKGSIFNGYGGQELMKDTACPYGVDQHSVYRNIAFAGANTYKLGLIGGDMAATPIAAVPNDIDGEVRNANFPYKGCDEKTTALRVLDLGGSLEAYDPTGQITVLLLSGCTLTDYCTADLIGNGTLESFLTFGDAVPNGAYTLDVISKNHLETYSAAAVAFGGPLVSYNFKPSTATAFGNNLTGGIPHSFFAGDRNQDGIVDLTDMSGVFNDASGFLVGCRLPSDMNGDEQVDLTDLVLTFNNSSSFVQVVSPCPEPSNDFSVHKEINIMDRKSRIIVEENIELEP